MLQQEASHIRQKDTAHCFKKKLHTYWKTETTHELQNLRMPILIQCPVAETLFTSTVVRIKKIDESQFGNDLFSTSYLWLKRVPAKNVGLTQSWRHYILGTRETWKEQTFFAVSASFGGTAKTILKISLLYFNLI